jgi:hypothetical protein
MAAASFQLVPQRPTRAQLVAGVLGAALVVVGLVGLAVDSSFATGSELTSDNFLGFAVNGWDDLIAGVALGLVLLAGAPRPRTARSACRLVGVAYLVLMIAGIAGGDDAFGFVPANTPDDVLRGLLALVTLWAAAASKDRRDTVSQHCVVVPERGDQERIVGPGSGHVGGPRATQPRIDRRLPQKQHP